MLWQSIFSINNTKLMKLFWLITIYLGKPIGSRFWAEDKKNAGLANFITECVYHSDKSVPFTEKRPQMPETSIKDGF